MLPIVVIPVLNEEDCLEATCRSLGFGQGRTECEAVLVLVDNGSTDATPAVAEHIRATSRDGSVTIVHERHRGFVPARMAGASAASIHAARLGCSAEAALLIQADADTIYEADYVASMISAALQMGRGNLYEGVSVAPSYKLDPCRDFQALEAEIDEAIDAAPDELDVVVDDKVAAFVLADYEEWGGHRREFDTSNAGDEWLAETTRLFIRARLGFRARRVRVENAVATTSRRRIVHDPAVAFATAGFPWGPIWRRCWSDRYTGPRTLDAFTNVGKVDLAEAIAMRRNHLTAMFQFLPELVRRMERPTSSMLGHDDPSEPGCMLRAAFDQAGVVGWKGAVIPGAC